METWLLYAIASIFFSGMYIFGMKVISMRNYSTSLASFYSYASALALATLYYFYTGFSSFGIWIVVGLAFGNILFYFMSTLVRVECLKYIDSVLFLPLYKTVCPILVTCISIFAFGEGLNSKDWFGIAAGICVPLLLITKQEDSKQSNLKKGVIFMVIVSILASTSGYFSKMIPDMGLSESGFLFFSMLFGMMLSFITYKKEKNTETKNKDGILLFGIGLGFFHFLSSFTFIYALQGNLAITYTINSFHILIPIILSVIFYKEEMTIKKAIVVALSIVSVVLFI